MSRKLISRAELLFSACDLVGREGRRRARGRRNLASATRTRSSEVDDANNQRGHRNQANHDQGGGDAAI
jgi:hypothetical protein